MKKATEIDVRPIKILGIACLLMVIGSLSACSSISGRDAASGIDPSRLALQNPMETRPGILTGGQPSESDLALLKQAGYGTVINLRADGEFSDFDEADKVTGLGMTYISLPVAGVDDITKANAEALDRHLADSDGPVLVHCASGNRVGALFALRARYLEGKSVDEALEAGRNTGLTRLEPAVQSLLAEEEQP